MRYRVAASGDPGSYQQKRPRWRLISQPANTNRYESAVARYFEAWNAREPQARVKAVAVAWAADGSYARPPQEEDPQPPLDGEGRIKGVLGSLDHVPAGA